MTLQGRKKGEFHVLKSVIRLYVPCVAVMAAVVGGM